MTMNVELVPNRRRSWSVNLIALLISTLLAIYEGQAAADQSAPAQGLTETTAKPDTRPQKVVVTADEGKVLTNPPFTQKQIDALRRLSQRHQDEQRWDDAERSLREAETLQARLSGADSWRATDLRIVQSGTWRWCGS